MITRQPFFTPEERKQKISHQCDWFNFESVADLSTGVTIYHPFGANTNTATYQEKLAQDVALFTAWWILNFHGRLNGFSGLDTISWTIKNPAKTR